MRDGKFLKYNTFDNLFYRYRKNISVNLLTICVAISLLVGCKYSSGLQPRGCNIEVHIFTVLKAIVPQVTIGQLSNFTRDS